MSTAEGMLCLNPLKSGQWFGLIETPVIDIDPLVVSIPSSRGNGSDYVNEGDDMVKKKSQSPQVGAMVRTQGR